MAALTLRCIAFAHRLIKESEVPIGKQAQADWQTPENDLILLAIAGIKVHFSLDKYTCITPNRYIMISGSILC
jgi:hypothetical protein